MILFQKQETTVTVPKKKKKLQRGECVTKLSYGLFLPVVVRCRSIQRLTWLSLESSFIG